MKRTIYLLPVLVVVLILLFSSLFVVDERQKALVLQFGRVVTVKEDPGLAFKLPLIQEVVYYDDRILSRDIQPLEVTPSDDRRLVVDAFARYRIRNVQDFRQAVGAGGEARADQLVDQILRAQLREVLGSVSSDEILSEDRAALMARIASGARREALDLGIYILDVRLMRTDLPSQNLAATFARMRAEREREAADEIARGQEAAQRIRAQADRTVIELTSEAAREAEITRGEADARRNSIFANAYTRDPEFFEFYRSLAAYTRALRGNNSTLVLSPDSEFFEYLQGDRLPGDTRGRVQALPTVTDPEGNALGGDAMEQSPDAAADETAPAGAEGAAIDLPTDRNVAEDEDGTVIITTTSD